MWNQTNVEMNHKNILFNCMDSILKVYLHIQFSGDYLFWIVYQNT
jgi:hypothetical protein